jgi:hypothetical protein
MIFEWLLDLFLSSFLAHYFWRILGSSGSLLRLAAFLARACTYQIDYGSGQPCLAIDGLAGPMKGRDLVRVPGLLYRVVATSSFSEFPNIGATPALLQRWRVLGAWHRNPNPNRGEIHLSHVESAKSGYPKKRKKSKKRLPWNPGFYRN